MAVSQPFQSSHDQRKIIQKHPEGVKPVRVTQQQIGHRLETAKVQMDLMKQKNFWYYRRIKHNIKKMFM